MKFILKKKNANFSSGPYIYAHTHTHKIVYRYFIIMMKYSIRNFNEILIDKSLYIRKTNAMIQ